VLLDSLDGDLTEALYCAAHGDLTEAVFPQHSGASVCVVLAARGYPDKPVTGDRIMGIEAAKKVPHTRIYGAGVASQQGQLATAGGRVLSVVGHGATVPQAKQRAYEAVRLISFEGMQYRTDIAG
jgi:phosphoribosylamine--glycine ligase